MKKKISLLLLYLVCSHILNAQNVKYSASENELYSKTESIIIGKVKSNIIIWKHTLQEKLNEFIIYDSEMNVINHVQTNILPDKAILCQLNFISHNNYFDVLIQYYQKNSFYCQIERLNENCEIIQPLQTIDKIEDSDLKENEIYAFIQSENNQCHALIRAVAETDKNKLYLKYVVIKNDSFIENESVLQFDDKTRITPFYLTDQGNIICAKYSNAQLKGNYTRVTFCSFETTTNSLSQITKTVEDKVIYYPAIAINNQKKEYALISLYKDFYRDQWKQSLSAPKGFFFYRFNDNFSNTKTSFFDFKSIANFYGISSFEFLAFHPEITTINNDFVIVMSSPYSSYFAHDNLPSITATDNFSSENLLKKPSGNLTPLKYNTLGKPSNPIYLDGNTSAPGSLPSDITDFSSDAYLTNLKKSHLVLICFNEKSQIKWALDLKNKSEKNILSLFNEGKEIKVSNSLYFFYSVLNIKTHFSQLAAIKLSDGKITTTPVNDSTNNTNTDISGGIKINEHAVIFPCVREDKVAFTKAEIYP